MERIPKKVSPAFSQAVGFQRAKPFGRAALGAKSPRAKGVVFLIVQNRAAHGAESQQEALKVYDSVFIDATGATANRFEVYPVSRTILKFRG